MGLNEIKVKLFDLSAGNGISDDNGQVLEHGWAFHNAQLKYIGLSDWNDTDFFASITVHYDDNEKVEKVTLMSEYHSDEYFSSTVKKLKEVFNVSEIHCSNFSMDSLDDYSEDEIEDYNYKEWIL
jgi:hypothetical protein